jgi:hypothetical protein
VASLSRVKGYKEETTSGWLQQAAEHAAQIENVLMSKYEIERGQLDALWSYVGRKERESEEGKKALLTTNLLTTRKGSTGDRR